MSRKLLEPVTTLVLVAVGLALGWIVAASLAPKTFHWADQEAEVIAILILLTAALILVSAVAIRHTHPRDLP